MGKGGNAGTGGGRATILTAPARSAARSSMKRTQGSGLGYREALARKDEALYLILCELPNLRPNLWFACDFPCNAVDIYLLYISR